MLLKTVNCALFRKLLSIGRLCLTTNHGSPVSGYICVTAAVSFCFTAQINTYGVLQIRSGLKAPLPPQKKKLVEVTGILHLLVKLFFFNCPSDVVSVFNGGSSSKYW